MKDYLKLGKFSVVLPVSFTAFTGYFLYRPFIDLKLIAVVLGVLLLGSAASALNQIQEKDIDLLMERTKKRPLPLRSISHSKAWLFFSLGLAGGALLLFIFGSPMSMIIGLFTIAWYNGLYTYLKRFTAFAVVPGALAGAMPPLIGWTAAGGNLADYTPLLLAFLLFVGQVPHFWLLMLKYGDQYRQAGLPHLTSVFSNTQIARITYAWILASLLTALLLPAFGILENKGVRVFMLVITLACMIGFSGLLTWNTRRFKPGKYFIFLNSFFMVVMILLIIDKILQ